jgi:hypothetical protein
MVEPKPSSGRSLGLVCMQNELVNKQAMKKEEKMRKMGTRMKPI